MPLVLWLDEQIPSRQQHLQLELSWSFYKTTISLVMQPLAMTDVTQAEQAPGDVWTGSSCHQQLQPWGQSTGDFFPVPDNTRSDSCWGEQLETLYVPLKSDTSRGKLAS